MAAVVVVILPPLPLPPPAPVPRISGLALAAADAVVCLWIASLWALFASVAAVIIDHLVCGCAGAVWAGTAALVSFVFAVIVWPLGVVLLGAFAEPFYTNQLEKGAAALEPISKAVIEAHSTAIVAFLQIEVFGLLLKLLTLVVSTDPVTNRTASVIMVVPPLGISVMCCLVTIPGLAVRWWRARRHGTAAVVPI